MDWWQIAAVLMVLAIFPPTRKLFKVWVLLSVVVVWLLDAVAGDVLGE